MPTIRLTVLDKNGQICAQSEAAPLVNLVYNKPYQAGDCICLETSEPGHFLSIRLEDSLPPALIYLDGQRALYPIPFAEKRAIFSPKAFGGSFHLICAQVAEPCAVSARRNLALNPFDSQLANGIYPHASANIETRGESAFAARNAIDGIFANAGHGEYPFQSWGIDRRADAALRIDLGVPAVIDEIRLTLRADFPHDNYWTRATLAFSDGSREQVSLVKSSLPQAFPIKPRTAQWVVLEELIASDDPSPFPALRQIEVWGTIKK